MPTQKLKKDKLEGRHLQIYLRNKLPATTYDPNYAELGQISWVKGTVLHKTALASDTSCQFGAPSFVLASDQLAINPGIPVSPFRFNNLLQRFIELRKLLYSELQSSIAKGCQSEPAKEKNTQRAEGVPDMKLPVVLSPWSPGQHCLLLAMMIFKKPAREACLIFCAQSFTGVSLQRHEW